MNKLQRKLIVGALVVVGFMIMFPPWIKRLHGFRGPVDTPMGYSFIMNTPHWILVKEQTVAVPVVENPAISGNFIGANEVVFDGEKTTTSKQKSVAPLYPGLPKSRTDTYTVTTETPSTHGVKVDLERLILQVGAVLSLGSAAFQIGRASCRGRV